MAKRLGISFGGGTLRALLIEPSRRSARILAAVEVPLGAPHGTAEDVARLAEELRLKGFFPLPPAVLSLPPAWTYLRRISLPVTDLAKAKRIHGQEFEGNLPVEGERFRSDVLPSAKGDPKRFLAVATLDSTARGASSLLEGAGITVERIVSDHVSAYGAFLALQGGRAALLCLSVPDLLFLETSRDTLLRARHLPAAAGDGALLQPEWDAFAESAGAVPPPAWHAGVSLPATRGGEAAVLELPGSLPPAWIPAFGASILPSYDRETGAFALRGEEHGLSEAVMGRRRFVVAASASALAIVLALGALGTAWWASGKRLAVARAALGREFLSVVPGGKVTVGELLQAQGRLQALEKQWKELGGDLADPVSALSRLSRSIPTGGTTRVREVSLEGERLRVAGDSRGSGDVEAFRSSLAGAFGAGWTITVQESRGSAKGETVSFTILVERGGTNRAE